MHIKPHLPSLRFAAVFSQQASAIDWFVQQASQKWGGVLLQSADFQFDMTSFYEKSMGDGLIKRLVAFQELVDPSELVENKHQSNQWEIDFRELGNDWCERPVNIDPGYLTEAKVVLMTTKDRDHRLYLGNGIYGEVTLFFKLPKQWVDSRWTYPDYRMPEYHSFFLECRDYLRKRLQESSKTK